MSEVLVYDEDALRAKLQEALSADFAEAVILAVRRRVTALPDPSLRLKPPERREAILDHLKVRVDQMLGELEKDFRELQENFAKAVENLAQTTEASLAIINKDKDGEAERDRLQKMALLKEFFDLLRRSGVISEPVNSLAAALHLTTTLLPKIKRLVSDFEALQLDLKDLPKSVRSEVGEEILDLLPDAEDQTALDLDLVLRILSEDGLLAEDYVDINRLPADTRRRLVDALELSDPTNQAKVGPSVKITP